MGVAMLHSLSLTIKAGDPFAWDDARAAPNAGVCVCAACGRVGQPKNANLLHVAAGAAGKSLPIRGLMDSTR